MHRLVPSLLILAFTLVFAGCKKDGITSEAYLYGIWVKGSQPGDTLQFVRKNGKSIIRTNESSSPTMAFYSEKEYRYRNGKLSIRLLGPSVLDFSPIDSFTWIREGTEFKIQGIQLFLFMSSTLTYFTYTKIN